MGERRSVVKALAERYRKVAKKEKGRMLDELMALTGYNRWYAVGLLSGQGKRIKVSRRLSLRGDVCCPAKRVRRRRYQGNDVPLDLPRDREEVPEQRAREAPRRSGGEHVARGSPRRRTPDCRTRQSPLRSERPAIHAR